jgi:hypothetical protein
LALASSCALFASLAAPLEAIPPTTAPATCAAAAPILVNLFSVDISHRSVVTEIGLLVFETQHLDKFFVFDVVQFMQAHKWCIPQCHKQAHAHFKFFLDTFVVAEDVTVNPRKAIVIFVKDIEIL